MVNALQNATFSFADFCISSPNGPTGIITSGGTFSLNPNPGGGVSINPVTGIISGATGGTTYTIQYITPGPCPDTYTEDVLVNALQNATFSFTDFCIGSPNGPTGIITSGGTFSLNPNPGGGVSINPVTGIITGAVAGTTYTVEYITPGPCPDTHLEDVLVNALQNATFSFADFCIGSPNGPTGIITSGGTFSLNPNPGGGVSINPVTGIITGAIGGTTYTVEYTTPGPCPDSHTEDVLVNAMPSASFNFMDFCVGAPNGPSGIITSGGTFSINPNPGGGVSINPLTGIITGAVAGTTYTVQYVTPGPCPDTQTEDVLVIPLQDAGFNFADFCTSGSNGPTGIITSGGTFSFNPIPGGGVSINPSTGVITGAIGGSTYTVQYVTPGPCPDIHTEDVTVTANPVGNLSGSPILCPGQCGQVTFNFTGGSGTFSINMNFTAGPININFPMVGVTNATVLTLCLNNGVPFDPATNTLNIPTFVPPGTYTLTLLNFSSTPAGLCSTGIVGVPGSLSITISAAPPTSSASITECDLDQNGTEIFNLTTVENTVKNNVVANSIVWFTDVAATNPILNPTTFLSGNATVYAEVSSPNGCSAIVPVSLILDLPDILNLADFASCVNGSIIPLPPAVSGFSGIWSGTNVTGGGSQFDPTGLLVGSYPITFTPTAGLCVLPLTVNVVISTAGPVPLISPIDNVCLGEASFILNTNQSGVNGVWSGSPFLTGNIFNVTASGVGSFTLTFTPTGSSTCFSANTTQIIVTANTNLPVVTFPDLCSIGAAVYDLGDFVGGESGNWSGNPQVSFNTFNPTAPAGLYPLIFTPTNVCVNPLNTSIEVLPVATLNLPPFPAICLNSAPVVLPVSVNLLPGTWTLNNVPLTIFDPAINGVGTFTLTFRVLNGYCALPLDVTISVNTISAGNDNTQAVCSSGPQIVDLNTFLSIGYTPGGIWKNSGVTIPNPISFDLSSLPSGVNVLSYILTDAICGADTAKITFDISFPNNAGNNSNPMLCTTSTSSVNFLSLLGTIDSGGTWMLPIGTSIDLTNLNNVNLSSLSPGLYDFSYMIPADNCIADTSHTIFNITGFNTAGSNTVSTLCLGSSIDLISLVTTASLTGNILNPNGISGLTGSIWNTTGLVAGAYSFEYQVVNISPCPNDTASLTVNLATSVNAGDDGSDFYCQGKTLFLSDYLAANASLGGTFYYNGVQVLNGIFDGTGIGNANFLYIVGGSGSCPLDTSYLSLNEISQPAVTLTQVPDLCENDCFDLTIVHNADIGSIIYVSVSASSGQFYKMSKQY
ncbi:MAG: hypothetical protein IPO92_05880 [Saprospiraceae bacterium]|nr:hypothetical protein [Saprospiraceae bacterium]